MRSEEEARWTGDPLIDEIYEIRKRISAQYGDDVDRLARHYMELQERFRDCLLSTRLDQRSERGERPMTKETAAPDDDPSDDFSLTDSSTEPDPAYAPVEEIREIRRRLMAEFGNDLDRYVEHLKEFEQQEPLRSWPRAPTEKASGEDKSSA